MIYDLLKRIVTLGLRVFFKKIVISGEDNLIDQGPLIIVSNHPNTLMDPLMIAAVFKQQLGFIANASIFRSKLLKKILTYFHVIPIYRKKDIQPGEKPDNRKAFSKCHEYLDQQGTLLIFPEGTSYYELKLREIKTGTARIALSFEDLKGFEGNLRIIPVALDYSDSIQFRSVVSVTVCRPLSVHAYRLAYDKNEFEAVDELTEAIRKELGDIIPQTSGKEQEEFLVRAHQFYLAFYETKTNVKIRPKQSLELRNRVSKALRYIQKENSVLYADTQAKLLLFFKLLREERLTANVISDVMLQKNELLVYSFYLFKFILLFPLYIFGLCTNYVPYMMTAKIFKSLKLDIEYKAPVQMITGFFTFPVYYGLIIWLFRMYISDEFWHSLLLFALMPITGYITLYYYAELRRFFKRIHFNFFIQKDKKEAIIQLKDEIVNNMEEARNYANVGRESALK